MTDSEYMQLALEEAQKGLGFTNPNPMVGAVIVKDNRIIATGYHHRYGDLHAERDALANCKEDTTGATMYVTLEPCCHHGKQPPCVEAIIEAGISKVVMGSGDPNELVAGKGIQILRDHGIEVVEHILEEECKAINEVFFHYIQTKTPYVVLKYAMTLDGKIAAYTGKSQWITGEKAREHVHALRHRYSGIMVGVGTVLADDPMLTCRLMNTKNPTRIVCDTKLRTPLSSKLVETAGEVRTIIATASEDEARIRQFEAKGCQVIRLAAQNNGIDIAELMTVLGSQGIDSVLVEGGATLNWSLIEKHLVNKVMAYVSPKLLGGEAAKSPVAGQGFSHPDEALVLRNTKTTIIDGDILIEGEVAECSQE